MNRILSILCIGILMSGCIEDFAPNPMGFAWESPDSTVTYRDDDLVENGTQVKLTYNAPLSYTPDIDFNSQDVAECFTFGDYEATADLYCFREFYKQGENRLQVQHENFGPSVFFDIETKGPSMAIREVCYSDSVSCSYDMPSDGEVMVDVEFRDPSELDRARLNGYNAVIEIDNKRRVFYVAENDTYTFNLRDINGYVGEHKYKADGREISEIVNVRVDETFINNIKDILGSAISGLSIPYGDSRLDSLQRLDGGTFGLCDLSVKAISLGDMEIKDIGITDNDSAQLYTDIDIKPINSNYSYNNGNVENNSNVGVDVVVEVRIIGFFCIAPINLGDMRIYIETMEVNADVDLKVENDKFTLNLNDPDSTGENALVMVDVSMDNDVLDPLVDFIMGLDVVQGLIRGIVQNVINANLDEIVIGGDIVTDNDTTMRIGMQPSSLYTVNNPDNIGDMFIQMKGKVETIEADPKVRPALGSYHVDDAAGLPAVPDNGSSLSVAVNSNMINQGLLAAYNVGITHITVMNGEVFIGPDATDDMGSNGDFRVELYPASPGQFFIEGEDTSKAYLEYNGAELTIWMKDAGEWKQLFLVDVDIKAGVLMKVVDSKFYMTIAETPTFVVRNITNIDATKEISTPFGTMTLFIKIDGKVVERLIEEAILFGVPYVAESNLVIDVSKLNLPRKLTTDTLSTEGGHLGFDMGVAE